MDTIDFVVKLKQLLAQCIIGLTENPDGTFKFRQRLLTVQFFLNGDGSETAIDASECTVGGEAADLAFIQQTYDAWGIWSGPDAANQFAVITTNVTSTPPAHIEVDQKTLGLVADDDDYSTNQDVPVSGNVLTNDDNPDGTGVTLTSFNGAAVNATGNTTIASISGSWDVDATGTFTFTPTAGFHGVESVTYEITDPEGESDTATVSATVAETRTLAVHFFENGDATEAAIDPAGRTVGGTPANLAYIQATYGAFGTWAGPDASGQFAVTTSDLSSPAPVNIALDPVTQGMTATDDSGTTPLNTPATGNILSNDTNPDGTAITLTTFNGTAVTATGTTTIASANGSWDVMADGSYTFTPAAGFTGTETVNYEATDAEGETDTAVVAITVNAPPTRTLTVHFFEEGDATETAVDPDGRDVLADPGTVANLAYIQATYGAFGTWSGPDASNQYTVTTTDLTSPAPANIETTRPVSLVYTITTTAPNEQHVLPLGVGTYDFDVEWGDGQENKGITDPADPVNTHTFAAPGTYTITIRNEADRFNFLEVNTSKDQVVGVDYINFRRLAMTDAGGMWGVCSNMIYGGTEIVETGAVTSFERSWVACAAMTTPPDTSGWDTSSVTTFLNTWFNCSSMTTPPDTSGWDTSAVTTFRGTWTGCSSMTTPPDTSGWDTSAVTSFQTTWSFCSSMTTPPDTSGWDTSAVTTFRGTWNNCLSMTTPPDTSGWDTSAVTTFAETWEDCAAMTTPPDTSGWDTSAVLTFSETWAGCAAMTTPPDTSGWDTSAVVNLTSTWQGCAAMTTPPDTSGWDTSALSRFEFTWQDCPSMTTPPIISGWNLPSLNRVNSVFENSSPGIDNAYIDAFLSILDSGGSMSVSYTYSTSPNNSHLDSNRSAAANAAVASLASKGWVRSGAY